MTARITEAFRVEEAGHSRGGRYCVRLLEPVIYHVGSADSLETITVPAGFVSDWASVPWWADGLFPSFGLWARPSLVHDLLYQTEGTGVWGARRYITRADNYLRKEADLIFREAMAVVGVPKWRREAMYFAVRAGGKSGWGT